MVNNMDFHIKSVDMSDPISPVQCPRGYGGVSILWDMKLSPAVTRLPDGNERIIGIKLQTYTPSEPDLCIFCVYFPCRGNTLAVVSAGLL